jgi:hypothetical protein
LPSAQEVREAARSIARSLGHVNPDADSDVRVGDPHPIWKECEQMARDALIAAEKAAPAPRPGLFLLPSDIAKLPAQVKRPQY